MNDSTPANSASNLDLINNIIKSLKDKPGALLPILHAIQNATGYIPKESIKLIGFALNQTPAEIYGVITFYHYFRTSPPANHSIQICRAEACQARGSRQLEQHVKDKLNIDYKGKTADGEFDLSAVYCLGNCSRGPTISINNTVFGSVTNKKFDEITERLSTYVVELN